MTNTNSTSRLHHHRPPVIIVHGGAWAIPDAIKDATEASVRRAASTGYQLLSQSHSALDAVEAAVRILEDDPLFDAGTGSCLTEEGTVEMDAAIMHEPASGLRSGAVAAVSNSANPISVARAVMEKTQHCLLVGRGADAFANHLGMGGATPQQLVTPAAQKEWKNLRRFGNAVQTLFNGHDTVGAVAMDIHGNLACATSTGGITGKKLGRVGDSPLFGSGLFCDRDVGACSTTGHGESIMQVCLARTALGLVEWRAMDADQACKAALHKMEQRTGGCGGIIMVDAKGNISHACTTKRMAWASVDKSAVLTSGIDASS